MLLAYCARRGGGSISISNDSQSTCKGGNDSCKGLNACKGQGFWEMTKAKCAAAKGNFEPA